MEKDRNEELVHSLWNIHHKLKMLHSGKASQSRILIVVNKHGTMTQRELTEHLHVQPGSVSEILSKMEISGLIKRTPNKNEQRTMDILLTEKGKTLSEEALEQRKALYSKLFLSLTKEEEDTLYFLLEKLLSDWDLRFDTRHQNSREE